MHANYLHFGALHLPVYSVFVVGGVIAALLLSLRTARLAHLDPDAVWDAGLLSAFFALVCPRLLLLAIHFRDFFSHPLLVLSSPPFSFAGTMLALPLTVLCLRPRNLPLASVLDAFAPGVALLWGILSLGGFVTGSRGTPSTSPWAVQDPVIGPIHPVEAYFAFAAFGLCMLLFRMLVRADAQGRVRGTTAASGIFLAGALAFFLDFFAQPSLIKPSLLIDPLQWLSFMMMACGLIFLLPRFSDAAVQPGAGLPSSPHAI